MLSPTPKGHGSLMAGISASGHREEGEEKGDLSLRGSPQATLWKSLEEDSSPKLIHYWREEDEEA